MTNNKNNRRDKAIRLKKIQETITKFRQAYYLSQLNQFIVVKEALVN